MSAPSHVPRIRKLVRTSCTHSARSLQLLGRTRLEPSSCPSRNRPQTPAQAHAPVCLFFSSLFYFHRPLTAPQGPLCAPRARSPICTCRPRAGFRLGDQNKRRTPLASQPSAAHPRPHTMDAHTQRPQLCPSPHAPNTADGRFSSRIRAVFFASPPGSLPGRT